MNPDHMRFEFIQANNLQLIRHLSLSPKQQLLMGGEEDLQKVAVQTVEGCSADSHAIFYEEQIVGFFRLVYPDDRTLCSLTAFMIDRAQQGRGLAVLSLKKIVEKVEHEFPHCKDFGLIVNPLNHRAIELYQRAGFASAGEWKDGSTIMRRALSRLS